MSSFPADTADLRRGIIETACTLPRLGLARGTAGPVSARRDSGFLVTPCGSPYFELSEDRIVALEFNRRYRRGGPGFRSMAAPALKKTRCAAEGVEDLADPSLSARTQGDPILIDGREPAGLQPKFKSYGKQTGKQTDKLAGGQADFQLPTRID